MEDSSEIPIVDFSAYRLSLDKPESSQFQKLVDDVHNALTTIGFFFIINTDFPKEKVEEMYQVSKIFFDLPMDVKQKYPRNPARGNHGYIPLQGENSNPDRPYSDLKECFNVHPKTDGYETAWPTEFECPGFKATMNDFFDLCLPIHNRVLEVMAHGLKLEDPTFFLKFHGKNRKDSDSVVRNLYYPTLTDFPVKKGQVRCGEHSDFGGITMLFQKSPGLEVRKRDGSYILVPLLEGGILINIGVLMQRWTADVYIAAKHRVLMDDTPDELGKSRQSLAFFGCPDYDAIIKCINKSNKYPPITCKEYMEYRFSIIY